jgi:aldehyde dehydrogenase (NAD+)
MKDGSLVQSASVRGQAFTILSSLGVPESALGREGLQRTSPITGEVIAHVRRTSPEETSSIIDRAASASYTWRTVPAPGRGKLVRAFAEELRVAKEDLGRLVTLETGKIISEGLGEVQEMIDICDFAVGLSRQLYGRTIASERADHRMMRRGIPSGSVVSYPLSIFPSRYGHGMLRLPSSVAIR